MRILVTGGTGFIGSHIVDKLVDNNDVLVVDNLSNSTKDNLNPRAEFHQLDINDPKIENVFKNGIDVVIHQAANVFVTKSIKDPVFDATSNILGSLNILENCRKFGVKKIIYANSGGAGSGEPEYLPVDENHPIKPLAPYGVSKHTVEHYLEIYSRLYGLKYTSLRYANIYGPRQNPEGEGGVVAIFISKLLKNQSPFIIGDGRQTRDMVFVEDVADANVISIKKGDNDFFNISTGKEISINDLFEMIKKMAKSSVNAVNKPEIPGEIKRSVLSSEKASQILGWSATTSIEKGLEKSIEYYKSLDKNKV